MYADLIFIHYTQVRFYSWQRFRDTSVFSQSVYALCFFSALYPLGAYMIQAQSESYTILNGWELQFWLLSTWITIFFVIIHPAKWLGDISV